MTTPSQPALSYRIATAADAPAIADLVNSAYRGDSSRQGWTTEADLLEGSRTSAHEVSGLIAAPDSVVYLCFADAEAATGAPSELVGCVNLAKKGDGAYLGMFVVKPTLQGGGLGKRFMQEAERYAQALWNVQKMWMTVITVRHELIAFYERRGYRRTGRVHPFPANNGKETMLVENLMFEEFEKVLPQA
ncbi:GNAT family N-acetyltransferase [Rhodoferax aquaticus]|uniref:GNAT family N-acetyltransferase n=1 Tax=Rhodoferax aquaticus TaxID=2527691 RepID=A0A515ELZ5_9BURK|nr:GNAT family N-acetyltransferase [Rhodoferax aquaticus]QDL53690.1 GNAT family N-acetyltransferase [Rhodoferax aquaticus]